MQTETFENAGQELDSKVKVYAAEHHCDYAEGLRAMKKLEAELWYSYASDESDLDRQLRKGGREYARRVTAYSEHFNIDRDVARRRVAAHDPTMRLYSKQGGFMNSEKLPLSAESVVDVRARERMEKGSVKDYGEAMKAVLADDDLLSHCYLKGLPYLEASAHAYEEDPMRSAVVQGIVGPPPQGQATSTEMPPSETGTTAIQELGVLISGARLPDNSPDVLLMLKISNMVPQLVRDAAYERMVQLAYALFNTLGLTGVRADRFPELFRQAQREHPGLAASAVGGVMNEEALREIYFGWFSRD